MSSTAVLQLLKSQVAQKFGNGNFSTWVNKDFQLLSEALMQASGICISPGTLKRVFEKVKTDEDYRPQEETKNALAIYLGYASWNDFKKNTVTAPYYLRHKNRMIAAGIFLMVLIALFFFFVPTSKPAAALTQTSSSDAPAPATVSYRFQHFANGDTLYFNDGSVPEKISGSGNINHYFKLPGYYSITNEKNEVLCSTLIPSTGWQSFFYTGYNPYPEEAKLYFAPLCSDTFCSLHTADAYRAGIDTNAVFWTEYRNYGNIKNDTNYRIRLKLKSASRNSTVLCHHVIITLHGAHDYLRTHFVKKGCERWADAHLPGTTLSGKSDNMELFSYDFTQSGTVEVESGTSYTAVSVNGREVIRSATSPGNIKGISITFSGSGVIEAAEWESLTQKPQ